MACSVWEKPSGCCLDPRLKQVFLVALSGYAQAEDIKRASSAGFHEYLPKPPSIERLEALLDDP